MHCVSFVRVGWCWAAQWAVQGNQLFFGLFFVGVRVGGCHPGFQKLGLGIRFSWGLRDNILKKCTLGTAILTKAEKCKFFPNIKLKMGGGHIDGKSVHFFDKFKFCYIFNPEFSNWNLKLTKN